MINVTLGEHPKIGKPFPKLMTLKNVKLPGLFLFINDHKCLCLEDGNDECGGIWDKGKFWEETNIEFFTDYNEPITIQNA